MLTGLFIQLFEALSEEAEEDGVSSTRTTSFAQNAPQALEKQANLLSVEKSLLLLEAHSWIESMIVSLEEALIEGERGVLREEEGFLSEDKQRRATLLDQSAIPRPALSTATGSLAPEGEKIKSEKAYISFSTPNNSTSGAQPEHPALSLTQTKAELPPDTSGRLTVDLSLIRAFSRLARLQIAPEDLSTGQEKSPAGFLIEQVLHAQQGALSKEMRTLLFSTEILDLFDQELARTTSKSVQERLPREEGSQRVAHPSRFSAPEIAGRMLAQLFSLEHPSLKAYIEEQRSLHQALPFSPKIALRSKKYASKKRKMPEEEHEHEEEQEEPLSQED